MKAPLDVACPFCGAEVGEECKGPSSYHPTDPRFGNVGHISRIRASNQKHNESKW